MQDSNAQENVILVVDDEPEVREAISEYLRESGYSVLEASGGPEALDLLCAHRGLRLIITDIRMPRMTGLELADKVAAKRGDMKIIFMSGYFSPQPIPQTFLRKPFRFAELAAAVQTELASS